MASLLKEQRQHAAHLAAAAGKHDAQGTAGLLAGIAHGISLPRRAADCAYRCDGNWTWVSDRMTWKLALVW
jgi:hypothetical protein